MSFLRKSILNAILLLIVAVCNAQNIQEQFSFRHLTEQNGLSHNIVNCMIKDHNGFFWIGTYDGLNRFDGFHFTVYKNARRDPHSLINNTVHSICEDKDGNIWSGTEDGISCWRANTGSFENYSLKELKGSSVISNILCGADGTIWASAKGGLIEYKAATNNFKVYAVDSSNIYSLSSDYIYKNGMIEDPMKNGIWLGTSKGLNFFDYKSKRFINSNNNKTQPEIFNGHIVSALCRGSNNTILFADNITKQLKRLTPKTNKLEVISFKKIVKNIGEISTMLEDSHGNYWLSSWTYDLFVIDGKNHDQQTLFKHEDSKPNSVTGDFFWSAYEDQEGTVWLGTVGGLSYTNQSGNFFKLHELQRRVQSLEMNSGIVSIAKDDDNSYWIGTTKNGLLHYFPGKDSLLKYEAPPFSFQADPGFHLPIRSLFLLKNKILTGTYEGVFVFDKKLLNFKRIPGNDAKKLDDQIIAYIVQQNDSTIWIRSFFNGLHKYNLITQQWKHYGMGTDSIIADSNALVRNIFVDSLKRLWLVGVPRTLALFDEKKDAFIIQTNEHTDTIMGNGYLSDVSVDQQNRFWLTAKGSGLVMFDPATKLTKRWSESEGLLFNHLLGIQAAKDGKVWMAGYNKVSMFDPATNRFQNFSFNISSSNYSYINRFARPADGSLTFTINSTLIEIDPSKIKGVNSKRQTLINNLMVFDQLKNVNERTHSVSLKYFENFINISYGVITNTDANRYHFKYRLEGYDNAWTEAGTNTVAPYTNLPGGDYTFRVKAVSNDENWEAEEAVLYIKLIPPFYKTSWFFALLTLLFAALIFAMVRYRIYTIRRTAQQKNDINKMMNEWQLKALRSQMNPHFIFNCLNSIDNYILKNDEENASRYLNKFSRLVRLILNHSDTNTTTLAKEVQMLTYYIELETLRFDEPFSFSIHIDDDIDLEETEIPSMLLQPYIENAILHGLKHKSGKGKLHINIREKNGLLFCVIEDDGIGRKRAAAIRQSRQDLHTSKGLGITEQRLKILQEAGEGTASVHIIDLVNKEGEGTGTRIEISIPFEKD